MKMTDRSDHLHGLRAHILRFFLIDGAKQTYEFLADPASQALNPRAVRRLIYSMAQAGLLEQFGATSGTFYLTTRLGFVVLATLENEFLSRNRRTALRIDV
jgi:hypothetical protein